MYIYSINRDLPQILIIYKLKVINKVVLENLVKTSIINNYRNLNQIVNKIYLMFIFKSLLIIQQKLKNIKEI